MPSRLFICVQGSASGYCRKPDVRWVSTDAVEWIDGAVLDAAADQLVELRTGSGDLHRARAADLRAAFPNLPRRTRAAPARGPA